jgi:hypothetical protein
MAAHHQSKQKGVTPPPPVGRCIYCDSTEEPLTKEHILPQFLHGPLTLRRASCESCREVTRRIETVVGREVFQDIRAVMGMRIKEPPSVIPFRDWLAPGAPVTHHIRPDDYPRFLFLLVPDVAGLLVNRPPGSRFNVAPFVVRFGDDAPRLERRAQQGIPTKFARPFDQTIFGRFLAKVALGVAVHVVGLDGLDPTGIRRVVLGSDSDWDQYVGGTSAGILRISPPTAPGLSNTLTIFGMQIRGVWKALVQIQLFAQLGTPIYTVVAGELNETGIKKLGAEDKLLQC